MKLLLLMEEVDGTINEIHKRKHKIDKYIIRKIKAFMMQ